MKMKSRFGFIVMFWLSVSISLTSCTKKQEVLTMDMGNMTDADEDPLKNKGIGPIPSVELGKIDSALVEKGEVIFKMKCMACHKFEEKVVGPALSGVTKRRSPEWIMNMILNPSEMVEKDPIVKKLVAEHMTKMTFQDVTKDDARAILEYFRQKDGVQ